MTGPRGSGRIASPSASSWSMLCAGATTSTSWVAGTRLRARVRRPASCRSLAPAGPCRPWPADARASGAVRGYVEHVRADVGRGNRAEQRTQSRGDRADEVSHGTQRRCCSAVCAAAFGTRRPSRVRQLCRPRDHRDDYRGYGPRHGHLDRHGHDRRDHRSPWPSRVMQC